MARRKRPILNSLIIRGMVTGKQSDASGGFITRICLGAAKTGIHPIRLEIDVDLPGVTRRLEFELNSEIRHLARLQIRQYRSRKGRFRLICTGRLDLSEGDKNIWLDARPGRHLCGGEPQLMVKRYGIVPFRIVSFKLSGTFMDGPAGKRGVVEQ